MIHASQLLAHRWEIMADTKMMNHSLIVILMLIQILLIHNQLDVQV